MHSFIPHKYCYIKKGATTTKTHRIELFSAMSWNRSLGTYALSDVYYTNFFFWKVYKVQRKSTNTKRAINFHLYSCFFEFYTSWRACFYYLLIFNLSLYFISLKSLCFTFFSLSFTNVSLAPSFIFSKKMRGRRKFCRIILNVTFFFRIFLPKFYWMNGKMHMIFAMNSELKMTKKEMKGEFHLNKLTNN